MLSRAAALVLADNGVSFSSVRGGAGCAGMWRSRSGQKLAHASRLVTRSAAKLPVSAQDQRVVAAGPKTSAGWRLLAA